MQEGDGFDLGGVAWHITFIININLASHAKENQPFDGILRSTERAVLVTIWALSTPAISMKQRNQRRYPVTGITRSRSIMPEVLSYSS